MKQKRFFLQIFCLSFILFGLFAGVIIVSNKDAILKRSSAASCSGLNKGCMTKACCPGLSCDTGGGWLCVCPGSCKNGCVKTDTGYECRRGCENNIDCPVRSQCVNGECKACAIQGDECDSLDCCSGLICDDTYGCEPPIAPHTPTPMPATPTPRPATPTPRPPTPTPCVSTWYYHCPI